MGTTNDPASRPRLPAAMLKLCAGAALGVVATTTSCGAAPSTAPHAGPPVGAATASPSVAPSLRQPEASPVPLQPTVAAPTPGTKKQETPPILDGVSRWAVLELDRGRACVELRALDSHVMVRDSGYPGVKVAPRVDLSFTAEEATLRFDVIHGQLRGHGSCFSEARVVGGEPPRLGESELFPTAGACEEKRLDATPLPVEASADAEAQRRLLQSCWSEARASMRAYLEELRKPRPGLSDAQYRFLALVARGLTIYKPNVGLDASSIGGLPPGCHPWIVRPMDMEWGFIERRDTMGDSIVVRRTSYRFTFMNRNLYLDYPGIGWERFKRTDLVHPTELHGEPGGGGWQVDTRVREPLGALPWFTTRKGCEDDAVKRGLWGAAGS